MIKSKKFTIEKMFIFAISYILVFVSSGHHIKEGVSNVEFKLTEIFFKPVFHSMFYNVFEIILLSFLVYIFIKSKLSLQNANKTGIFIFTFAVLCYVLNMINPNASPNNPILGMPLFSNVCEYLFLFLLYIFFFTDRRKITYIILLFFKYIFILSLIRGLIIILQYFIGMGPIRFGRVVTLLEFDVLFQYAILTVICFTAYLLRKDWKTFALTLLFFFIVFMSTARSSLVPVLIAITCILSVFIFKRTQVKKTKIIILGFILLLLFVLNFEYLPDPFKRTYSRLLAGISRYAISGSKEITTGGHWEQSYFTTISIIQKGNFWGDGYGSREKVYLQGQTVNIHNAYAGLWEKHGLHMLIFYLSLLVLVIIKLFRILRLKKKYFSSFYWFKLNLSFYYIGYAATAYVGISTLYTHSRIQFILVLIWVFIFRVKEEDFKYIMEGTIIK